MRLQHLVRIGVFLPIVFVIAALMSLSSSGEPAAASSVQLKNDSGRMGGYISDIRPCWVFGSVLRGTDSQYPMQVRSVDFLMTNDFQPAAPSARVRAVIYGLDSNGQPTTRLAESQTVTITSFAPAWSSIPITTSQVIFSTPTSFLAGVEYEDGIPGTVPSVMTDNHSNIPINRNFYSQSCGGSWFEHYRFWIGAGNVGYNMVRARVDAGVTPEPIWTLSPTPTLTPGPSPTPIPGQVLQGGMVAFGKSHNLARTPNGRLHLLYVTDPRRDLYHIWSDDNGATWQPSPPLLAASANQMEISVAPDPSGGLNLQYGGWDGQRTYYKHFDGTQWGPPTFLADGAFGRNIAVDSAGHVHVLWSNSDTWYARFDGQRWTPPRQIAYGAWHPTIAVGPDDSLHVAYNDNDFCCDHDGVQVRYIASTDGGDTWSQPVNVSQNTAWSGGAALAVSQDGVVHLVYVVQSPVVAGGLYYRQFRNGRWSPAEVISSGNAGVQTGSTGAESPAISTDTTGNVFVAYRCLNAANLWDVCLRVRAWQGWLPVMNLTNNSRQQSGVPSMPFGIIPSGRGLDLAWNTDAMLVHRYVSPQELGIPATPTPSPTPSPTPAPYHVRVVDDAGQPVDGARVALNGALVTDADGHPKLTANGGVLDFPALQAGDTLTALAVQEQIASQRGAHDTDVEPRYPNPNWAYRVYLTSVDLDDQGRARVYHVPDASPAEHTLVVRPRNPLVLFNLVVSVEWDADAAYADQLTRAFQRASNYLYDLSDGQMAFGQVTIYDHAAHWNDADIQVSTENIVRPHAHVGGITDRDTSHVLRLGRFWDGDSGNQGPWDEPNGFRTLVHEFGHYALSLYDEYLAYTFDDNRAVTGQRRSGCTSLDHASDTNGSNASVMDYQYTTSEFDAQNVPGLWSPLCRLTVQWQFNGESAWETIARKYSDTQTPARWRLNTPMERGHVMPGPDAPDGSLSPLPMVVAHVGTGGALRQLTVRDANGPYLGAIVALYKSDGRVIDQGFTDALGRLDVYGAAEGDTIRAASFDAGLSGHVTVTADPSLTVTLSPLHGVARASSGGAPSSQSPGGSIPHLRVVPEARAAPDTVDLAISLLDFGPGADPNIVVTEPGSDVAHSPELSYSATTGSYEGAISFSATERGTGRLRAAGGVSNALVRLQSTYRLQQALNDRAQDIFSDDGNLQLHVDSESLPGSVAYFAVMPPGAVPGDLPSGLTLVGDVYDITASGALTSLGRPAALTLHYDAALVNPVASSEGFGIYRWDPNDRAWRAVTTQIEADHQAATSVVTNLGAYAILAPPGAWMRPPSHIYLPLLGSSREAQRPPGGAQP
ncbi:MAG: sialidase family protein [Anaerolineae bacterium]